MPRTAVGVDIGAATFDVEGHRGNWRAVTPTAELSVGKRVSLFAALPIARVALAEGEAHTGIGDAALSAKVAIYATPHGGLLLSAGLGVEIPTGDEAHGLGGGHVELSPFLVASSALASLGATDWIAYGLAAPRFALADHAHDGGTVHGHGSFLAPHAGRELFGRLMTALVYGVGYAGVGGEGAVAFQGGEGYAALRAEGGYRFGGSLRVFVGVDGSVAGQHRFGIRSQAGVAWLF